MFIHLYSIDTWGFTQDKIDDKDISISDKEFEEILSNKRKGFYYRVANPNGTTVDSLLESIIVEQNELPKPPLTAEEQHLLFEENIEKTIMLIDLDFRLTKIELGL